MQSNALRLAWGVGGRGRILEAVIEANAKGLLATKPALVIVSAPSPIEAVASRHGIASRLIEGGRGKAPKAFHDAFTAALVENRIDWLGLTFDKLLAERTIDVLQGKIFNVHMSLLPLFPGFGAVRKALSSGMRVAGVTVHMVGPGMDDGPILGQAIAPILAGDAETTLGRRLFERAVPLVLQVVRAIERHELTLDGKRQPQWSAWAGTDGSYFAPSLDQDLTDFAQAFCSRCA
ncbi:phosphoribosylglycinamide formyltransferase [Methylocapsa acidiphila]|uniref:phosphoribosylglycinamide formyltransferase n=1 Tax=Methylocapsa acidiphila TaxID=133552 RepID=UPI0004139A2D|nr:formyltransferase family protein [Methylocapsa acidiphila]